MNYIKYIFILLPFLTFAQDAIFNINTHNQHQINKAVFEKYDFTVKFDNVFENYRGNDKLDNRHFFSNTLNINYRSNAFSFGADIGYNYNNGTNNIRNLDAIIGYHPRIARQSRLSIAVNIGLLNTKLKVDEVYNRYTFDFVKPYEGDINSNNLNIGFSTALYIRKQMLGLSANYINQALLPDKQNSNIPIKYTAYIRNTLIRDKLVSTVIYQYQDEYLPSFIDADYYFNIMKYLGVNLEYKYEAYTFGMGTKFLSNNEYVLSLLLSVDYNYYSFFYSPSIMIGNGSNEIAAFNQIGIYYHFQRKLRGRMYTIGCPAF